MAKYTVLTTPDRKQLHVVKTTVADPADGNWASQDSANSPLYLGDIVSYWATFARPDTPDIDNIQSDTFSNFGQAAGVEKEAQSFTSVSGAYAAFEFRLRKQGSPTDAVRMSLQGDNAGEPNGIPIESLTIDSSDITTSLVTFIFALTKPVFVSSGDVYWLVFERTGSLNDTDRYQSSVDGGSNYANGSRHTLPPGGVWGGVLLDHNFTVFLADIHIVTQNESGRVAYHLFDPGTDAWTIVDEFIAKLDTHGDYELVPDQAGASLAVRSDGDVIVAWIGQDFAFGADNLFWARRESGVWTLAVLATSPTVYNMGDIIGPDIDDRVYLVFARDASTVFTQPIKADNTLGTLTSLNPTTDTALLRVYRGFVDKTGRMITGWIGADDKLSQARRAPNDTPTSISKDSLVTNFAVFGHGRTTPPFMAACLAGDGDVVHLIYVSDVDQDIYQNNNTGGALNIDPLNEIEIEDAVTCNRISCRVNGVELQYIYDDGGTTKYGTHRKAGETRSTLSGGILGQQNTYAGPFEI